MNEKDVSKRVFVVQIEAEMSLRELKTNLLHEHAEMRTKRRETGGKSTGKTRVSAVLCSIRGFAFFLNAPFTVSHNLKGSLQSDC